MTTTRRSQSPISLGDIAWRLWWGGLVVLHIWVFWRFMAGMLHDGLTIEHVLSAGALVASIAFFLLKALDVSFLRFGNRKVVFFAFVVMAAMIHHEAISSALGDAVEAPAPAVLVGTIAIAALLTAAPLLSSFKDFLSRISRRPILSATAIGRLNLVLSERRHLGSAPSMASPRAPPA